MSAQRTRDCPTDETLATFVDRRLSPGERSAVVDHLARCDGCREVIAETVRFEEEQQPATLPEVAELRRPVPRRSRRLIGAALAAAAAGLLAVVLVPRLSNTAPSSTALVADLSSGAQLQARLGSGWESPLWSGYRGEGVLEAEPTAAFRLGVRVVDLRTAVRAEDRTRAQEIARTLRQTLSAIPLGAPLAASYDQILARLEEGAGWGEIDELVTASERLLDSSLDTEHTGRLGSFSMGRFAAAGRLAARTESAELLGSRRLRSYLSDLRAARPAVELDPVLEALDQRLATGSPPLPYAELESSFADWIRLGGEGVLETHPP